MNEVQLNNGVSIPAIGIGPAAARSGNLNLKSDIPIINLGFRAYNKFCLRPVLYHNYVNSVAHAFQAGFRLLDFSSSYGDGVLINKAIRKSRIDRKDLFLTTRVSNQAQRSGKIRECLFQQLEGMGTDYVDLLMFHWPVTDLYLDTWKQMVQLYKEGYCRTLGVANCHKHHLEALLSVSEVVPAINQIEVHPLFTQKELVKYCKSCGIQVEAYTPIARMDVRLTRLPLLKRMSEKYHKSIAQIILRWHIQNGLIPVVRSLNKKRQLENISIFDFELSADEMIAIDNLNINSRLRFDPDNCDFSIL